MGKSSTVGGEVVPVPCGAVREVADAQQPFCRPRHRQPRRAVEHDVGCTAYKFRSRKDDDGETCQHFVVSFLVHADP